MKAEIAVAVIALAGVLVSALTSYLMGRQAVKNELSKHRTTLLQEYGKLLFEERLERYPYLYQIICRYARELKRGADLATVQNARNQLEDWDVNHSLLMSAKTQYHFHLLQREVIALSSLDEEQFKKLWSRNNKEWRETSNRLELSLKNEIGAYSFESPYVEKLQEFDSYAEADRHAKHK